MTIRRTLLPAALALALGTRAFAAFSYFSTVYDTDWTSVGTGAMRGVGSGTLALSGTAGTVTGAYLFWHGPTNSADPLANASVVFNGNAITGVNIGISQNNNWGFLNSQAYRANVTAWVTGDGTYSLANFIKPDAEINGASLYVTYDNGIDSDNRDLVLFNGNDSNVQSAFDPSGWSVALNGVNYSGGAANLRLTVSDGQDFGLDEALYLNGSLIIPEGPNWQGALGTDPGHRGALWDEMTFALDPYLAPGINNLQIQTYDPLTDALSLVVGAIDLPAGAAPPDAVPEPSTYGLIGAGVLLGGILLRRRLRR